MRSSRHYSSMQIKVGSVVALGLGIALLAMIFPTKGVNLLSPKIELISYFENISGLRASSPVWFAGIEIGQVTDVAFVAGSDPTKIKVVMQVEKKIQKYIKQDSVASITGMGLLGDMYVEILPGSKQAASVADGDLLVGRPAQSMQEDIDKLMASAKEVMENLAAITLALEEGQGSLGKLFKDDRLFQEMRDVVKQLQVLTTDFNHSQGTARKLIHDPQLYDELVASVKDIRGVVRAIDQAQERILTPETEEKIVNTVETANRVAQRMASYQKQIDQIRLDFSFGLQQYAQALTGGHARVHIWPNENRYYALGIQQISALYGNETDATTWDARLGWRILETPFFIHGGLIKDEFFAAGLDLRLLQDDVKVILDAYRVRMNPIQLDAQVGVVLLDLIELNAGVEDVFREPFYKGGLTIHYRDKDFINVLLKALF